MADERDDPKKRDDERQPWPEESDRSQVGERFERGPTAEQRRLRRSFESSEADENELGREFADPEYAERQLLARSFADPNALDDARLGKSFEETNSSGKRKKPPVRERVHKPAGHRNLWIFLVAFAVLFLVMLLVGWLPRHNRNKEIDQRAKREHDEKPVVDAAKVEPARNEEGLVLPGTTIPLTEAYVYARASGYLKTRLADIGDHVRKNQLLAVIDAPDLDQQVAQAKQQLMQAEQQLDQQKSQLALATATVQRYRVLVAKGVFSRQDGDQQEANYASQLANVAGAQRNVDAYHANLERMKALQSYEYVRAPFSGVVTQRNVDVGALIAASGTTSGAEGAPAPQGQTSTSGGSAQAGQVNNGGSSGAISTAATTTQSPGQGGPLFGIAQTQRLRVLVSVPEGYVTSIHAGGHAQLSFQEYPGVNFTGDITRTADSVDPNTRTMLTEVQVDNHNGKLVPGMYTVVTFPPAQGIEGPLLVSADAIVIRHDQTTIAKIVNGKVRMVPVTIGRDLGDVVEILTGLQAGDVIVTNVTDDVVDGAEVQPHLMQTQEQQPQQAPQNAPPGGNSRYSNEAITNQNLQGKQTQQSQKNQQQQGNSGQNQKNRSQSESKP
ncbi:MAG TPA: efflux RND transporter periplasmic adaptor subunit [Acidobacteriaceae bacterium]|nr:efflux RND transporter periplasmic adaptor subunit [Acidobacteriaceae bacterium]